MLDIPCVIFAGGKSSRMGEDKALLPFSSFKTLTEFQLSRLSLLFDTVYVSCKDKSKFHFEASFIEDIESNDIFAPTAGFIASFEEIDSDKIFVISVDSPFISEYEISKIIKEDNETLDAVVAKTKQGMQPMCGVYHRSLAAKFQDMQETNTHKLGQLLKSSHTKYIYFEDEKPFLNLNHPHEYKEALSLI